MTARTALSFSVATLIAILGAPARAQSSDSSPRDGFMIAAAAGPGGYFGFGEIENTRGGGGMLVVRFGTKATENLQFLVEFDIGAYITKVEQLDGSQDNRFNQHRLSVLGMQYYPAKLFWVRGGLGVANFSQGEEQGVPNLEKTGLGVMAGLGYDVFRRGIFVLDIELNTTTGVYSGATLFHTGLFLGFNWY